MPELPDLLYIKKHLQAQIEAQVIARVVVKNPIVTRNLWGDEMPRLFENKAIKNVIINSPFIELIMLDRFEN